jgi:hypothetical protein
LALGKLRFFRLLSAWLHTTLGCSLVFLIPLIAKATLNEMFEAVVQFKFVMNVFPLRGMGEEVLKVFELQLAAVLSQALHSLEDLVALVLFAHGRKRLAFLEVGFVFGDAIW